MDLAGVCAVIGPHGRQACHRFHPMCLEGPWGKVKLVKLAPGHNPRIDLPPREKGPLMQVGGLQGQPAGQEVDATALAVAKITHEECWEIQSRF